MTVKDLISPVKYYYYFKKRSLLKRFKKVGNNFIFDPTSSIMTPELVEIGDNVFIGEKCHISAEVKMGNNIMFGPRPIILGGDHHFAVKGRSVRFLKPKNRDNSAPIHIEDETWFGAGVIILKGVTVGIGSVIGAGSVVKKSIPPFCVAVGNPCEPVRMIFDDHALLEHLTALNYSREFAENIVKRRNTELIEWQISNLTVIEKTDSYWETKTNE